MKNNKTWFTMSDNKEADAASISIYDEIGFWGVTLEDFSAQFKEVKDRRSITLYLNSPGGEIFQGMGIYNLLSTVRERLTVEIIGYAASMASIIALAGDRRVMNSGTMFMIHNPGTSGFRGDSEDFRKHADLLDKIKQQGIEIYQQHTNLSAEELAKMMDDETWLSAEEALKYGFATEVNKYQKAVACAYNLESMGFKNVPRDLIRPTVSIEDMSVREFESFLRDAGLSRQDAVTVASKVGIGKQQVSDSPVATEIEALNEIKKLFI